MGDGVGLKTNSVISNVKYFARNRSTSTRMASYTICITELTSNEDIKQINVLHHQQIVTSSISSLFYSAIV